MPMIMEDENQFMDGLQDVDAMDDLFNEPAESFPFVQPAQKGLVERLNELSTTGCCQRISWSKFGTVAHISDDSSRVYVQAFATDPAKGCFELAEPVELEIPETVKVPIPFVHICWSSSGLELAAIDACGRIFVFVTILSLNRLRVQGYFAPLQIDALSAVVGIHWLPVARPTIQFTKAIRADSNWEYKSEQIKTSGPSHPVALKTAFIVLTRGGLLRLAFGDPSNQTWHETTKDIGRSDDLRELTIHASFTPETGRDTLLLTTYDIRQTICIYRVQVKWTLSGGTAQAQGQQQHPTKVTAVLEPSLLHTLGNANSIPTSPSSDVVSETYSQLCHLQMLPITENPGGGPSQPATIVGTFSVAEASPDSSTLQHNSLSTRVVRWTIHENEAAIHPSFSQLVNRNTTSSSQKSSAKYITLKRLPDVYFAGSVISMLSANQYTLLCFHLSNGAVDFYDRSTMQRMEPSIQRQEVNNILEAGWGFTDSVSYLHATSSPSLCAMAYKGEDGEPALRYIERRAHDEDQAVNSKAAILGVVLAFANSVHQSTSNDDLVALVMRNRELFPVFDLLDEIFKSCNITVEWTARHPGNLFRSPPLMTRCLSLQLAIGQNGVSTLSSKVARIIVNIRTIFSAFSWGAQITGPANTQQQPPIDQESPRLLVGPIKYFFDLVCLILMDLLRLSRACQGKEGDMAFVREEVAKMNSVALPIVLCSTARSYLIASASALKGIASRIPGVRTVPPSRNHFIAKAWSDLYDFIASSPTVAGNPTVKYPFESILNEMDHLISTAYDSAGLKDSDARTPTEKRIIIDGHIPDVLAPAVERLLSVTIRKKLFEPVEPEPGQPAAKPDTTAMYFADVRLLQLTDDAATREFHEKNRVDCLRKIVLPPGQKKQIRRCTRCCSYAEDFDLRNQPVWILSAQKSCICGNPWVLVNPK